MTDGQERRPVFVRNLNAGQLLESLLIAAIATLLVVRMYLRLTGYPQLGGHGLHIAHMLWGGLLMLVAVFMLLAYLGHRVRRVAAIVGGIGFGLFIDELGKFITSDNDYFYRPAIALIYAIFVLLFIWWRALERRRPASEETYLANSLMLMQDAALRDLDVFEKFQLENWMKQSGKTANALLGDSQDERISRIPPALPASPALRRFHAVIKRFRSAIRSRWAGRLAMAVLLARMALAILASIGLLITGGATGPGESIDLPLLISGAISGFLAMVGLVYLLLRSRLRGLRWFRRSIIASIFLTDLFTFYYQQLGAIAYLAVDLILLAVLDELLNTELRQPRALPPSEPQAASSHS